MKIGLFELHSACSLLYPCTLFNSIIVQCCFISLRARIFLFKTMQNITFFSLQTLDRRCSITVPLGRQLLECFYPIYYKFLFVCADSISTVIIKQVCLSDHLPRPQLDQFLEARGHLSYLQKRYYFNTHASRNFNKGRVCYRSTSSGD